MQFESKCRANMILDRYDFSQSLQLVKSLKVVRHRILARSHPRQLTPEHFSET
jgi:hypothetical protein